MGADCSIIGGNEWERLLYAIRLRRMGISTWAEVVNRKRAKMFAKAMSENRWGKGGVYDLDDDEDRTWLERNDLQLVGV